MLKFVFRLHIVPIRPRSHEHFLFGKDQSSQKLWKRNGVHTQQRKVLKTPCQSTQRTLPDETLKTCHIFHADIVKLCQMNSAKISVYASKFN